MKAVILALFALHGWIAGATYPKCGHDIKPPCPGPDYYYCYYPGYPESGIPKNKAYNGCHHGSPFPEEDCALDAQCITR